MRLTEARFEANGKQATLTRESDGRLRVRIDDRRWVFRRRENDEVIARMIASEVYGGPAGYTMGDLEPIWRLVAMLVD